MLTAFSLVAQVIGILLLADFIAGVVHWLEDTYGTENTPIVGPLLIRPNIVHHHFPRHFTKLSWWQSSADLLLLGVLLIAAGWRWDFLSWQLWLFVVFSVNANQVHKWAHRTRAENGKFISFLQDLRLLQTPAHHALHHTDPKNTFYCPITNLLNPLLERVQFWTRLEGIIARLTGIEHRQDTSNRGQGPGPEWLAAYRPPHRAAPLAPTRRHSIEGACHCAACPRGGGPCARRRRSHWRPRVKTVEAHSTPE